MKTKILHSILFYAVVYCSAPVNLWAYTTYPNSIFVYPSSASQTDPYTGKELLIGDDNGYYVCMTWLHLNDSSNTQVSDVISGSPWDYVEVEYETLEKPGLSKPWRLYNCTMNAPIWGCAYNRYYDISSYPPGCKDCNTGQIASAVNGHQNNYCSSSSYFSCPSGTYGSPGMCSGCPDNATCSGGASFSCNSGYYKNGGGCATCPANTSSCGGSSFSCVKGFYKSGGSCSLCPRLDGVAGTTGSSGGSSISSCYLPSGSSASDGTGAYTYTGNCGY